MTLCRGLVEHFPPTGGEVVRAPGVTDAERPDPAAEQGHIAADGNLFYPPFRNQEDEQMPGAGARRKGNRVEREIVDLHRAIDVEAERYPLSGSSHFRGSGHDLDLYLFEGEPPVKAEVKARKNGEGLAFVEHALEKFPLLFTRRNNKKPRVHMTWELYERLVERGKKKKKKRPIDVASYNIFDSVDPVR